LLKVELSLVLSRILSVFISIKNLKTLFSFFHFHIFIIWNSFVCKNVDDNTANVRFVGALL